MSNVVAIAQNYSLPGNGLSVWTGIAKAIRISTRGGVPAIPISKDGLVINADVTRYITRASVLLACLFLAFFFVLFGSIIQCCCLCFNKKSIIRKQRTRVAGPIARAWAWFTFGLVITVYFVGAITSFSGGSYLTSSFSSANNGTLSLLNNTKKVFNNLNPTISQSFGTLKGIVNNTIDEMTNLVNFNDLDPIGVTGNLTLLANSMENAQSNIDSLRQSGTAIKNRKATASALVDAIVTRVLQIDFDVGNLTLAKAVPNSGSVSYRLTTAVSTGNIVATASSAQSGISGSADGESTFSSLSNTPNLVTYATEIRSTVTTLRDNVARLIVDGGATVKASLGPSLDRANDALASSIDPATASLNKDLSGLYKDADNAFIQIRTFDMFRVIAMSILSALILVIIIVWTVGAYCAKPKVMKGCNLTATPLYLLIQILAILLFVIAYLVGESCNAVFETSPPALGALNPDLNKTLVNVARSRALCAANGSLLDVAVTMNLVDAESVNISSQAKKKIDEVDFSSISNFNLSSSVSLSDSPSNKLSTVSNLNLATLNTTSLDNVTSSTLPSLTSSLTSLSSRLTTLFNTVTAADLTFNPSSPSGSDQTAAVNDIKARINAIITIINSLTSSTGDITYLSGNITQTSASINATLLSATYLKGNVSTISSYYNASTRAINDFSSIASQNVTSGIPTIKARVVVRLQEVDAGIQRGLSCYDISQNLNTVQDAVCGQFVAGLDSVWLAYFFIGIFAAASMPTIIYFANVRVAHDFPRVDPSESDSESKGKKGDRSSKNPNVLRSAAV